MLKSFRTAASTSARSLLANHPTALNSSAATTATTTTTPAMALSTTSNAASHMLLNTTEILRNSEQTWENYGFDEKESGWGAWFFVP